MSLSHEIIDETARMFAEIESQIYDKNLDPTCGYNLCTKVLSELSFDDRLAVLLAARKLVSNVRSVPEAIVQQRNHMMGWLDDDSICLKKPVRSKS